MRLGVGIAQIARTFAVLVDDAHCGLNDVLRHRRFARWNLLLRGYRPTMLPGEPRGGDGPAKEGDDQQDQQGLAKQAPQP